MRIILLSLLLLIGNATFAQIEDTIWYNKKWEKTDKSNKFYYRVIQKDDSKNLYLVRDFYSNGATQMEGYFTSLNPDIRNGEFKWWFENGSKQREAIYKDNIMVKTTEWEAYGKVKNQNELVKTVSYKDGEPVYELKSIEIAPVFPGGISALNNFIASNAKYPSELAKNGISGKVIIRFMVNKKGKIVAPEVVQSVHPLLDQEALRVINLMPRWQPGKQEGKNVNVKFALPITFQQ